MRVENCTIIGVAVAALLFVPACSRKPAQTKFATAEEASAALLQALKTNDKPKLEAIFGADAVAAVASGDAVSDHNDREVVSLAMEQSMRWVSKGSDTKELIVGDEQWPFPVPLVKAGDQWRFDSEAGKQEVLARRIGRNELGVIDLCREYVDKQQEYAAASRDGKRAGLFAQRVRSTPGHQDGLYWPASYGQPPSPLGDLIAEAAAEGYQQSHPSSAPAAFWGYHFRILTAQGDAAPGGKKSYIVNGEMSGGFGLLAYPAKYGSSGVMTFVVNQDGVVYEKDLGKDTATLAVAVSEYNPDSTWNKVQ